MRVWIADAFTDRPFSGNQAGVALLEAGWAFPPEGWMLALAAELKHSETAFVLPRSGGEVEVRYFTPAEEVDLCGHATIALFTILRDEAGFAPGEYTLLAKAGRLPVTVEGARVWMDMAPAQELRRFTPEESAALYAAFGLEPQQAPDGLAPWVVSTGLADILLPVRDETVLQAACMDAEALTALSRRYEVVGAHLFCPGGAGGAAAHCRNFAPLYGIPEEAATGTSNGALSYYLYRHGLLRCGEDNLFVQGEAMGKPSQVYSRLTEHGDDVRIRVGGSALVSLRGTLPAGVMP